MESSLRPIIRLSSLSHASLPALLSRVTTLKVNCPWQLLAASDPVFCWQDGRREEVWFALGSLREFDSPTPLREALRGIQRPDVELRPRGFGVLAFDASRENVGIWRGFPVRRFVIPQVLVRWREGIATVLTLADSHPELTPEIRRLTTLMQRTSHYATPRHLNHGSENDDAIEEMSLFHRDAWQRAVQRVQEHIRLNHLQKVVLARQTILNFADALDPIHVLMNLVEHAPDSIVFALRQREGVFLGATPERLFTLQRNQLTVDSLAGTRPRGASAEEDQHYSEDLARSEKERWEQQLVTDHVVQQMQRICDDVVIEPAPRIRKLKTVQHLATTVVGSARESIALDAMLDTLHPTPATCGYPIAPAREVITALEQEPRGLYSGAIGWVDAENAEFAVAIRSGLIQQNEARLFAGAGIVAGSDPEQEYQECEWKMLPLRRAMSDE